MIRVHRQERRGKFTPSKTRGCPIDPKHLTSMRRTVKYFEDGSVEDATNNWRSAMGKKAHEVPRVWIGFTEFTLRTSKPEMSFMVKKGSDEITEDEITKQNDWAKWTLSDAEEWKKVEATGAVRVLTVEESEDVKRQLAEAGLIARILPSRMVRRWKPSEQPGTPPTRKSRWCVRGDQDPDILDLQRHAPTVTAATLAIALQIAVSLKFRVALGDLRNAFMQSEELIRVGGRLFCQQPLAGLPGLSPSNWWN